MYRKEVEVNSESVRGATVINLSELPTNQAYSNFPNHFEAEKIVILPDFSPGRAPLPNGSAVQFDLDQTPNWRKYSLSDIGCGMKVLKSQVSWQEFIQRRRDWDAIVNRLKVNMEEDDRLGNLGHGNHFLDAAVDLSEEASNHPVYFVVHTGSRNEAKRSKIEDSLDNTEVFDITYQRILEWARANRDAISDVVARYFGALKPLFDRVHNNYTLTNNKAIVYKGAVRLHPGEESLIPSSMLGDMVVVKGLPTLAQINYAVSHGTGRIKPRGESRDDAADYDFDTLRKGIYIPSSISNASIRSENPSCYRDLDACLKLLNPYVTETKRMSPIAYIGQL